MRDGGVRLEAAFRDGGRPVFVPYVMGGYPTLDASRRHAAILSRHAGVLELGVPYSDPLADGPTIQAAGQTALRGGTRPEHVIEIAEELRGGPPIAVMTYYNTLLRPGVDAFIERASRAGVAGLIIPDLPVDESDGLRRTAADAGIALVALAAPTSTDARLAEIGERAAGFVYAVSVTGVTGGDVNIGDALSGFIARLRAAIDVPIAVGFGVRTPEQAAAIGQIADGAVVASQIIRLIEDTSPDEIDAVIDAYGASIDAALAAVVR